MVRLDAATGQSAVDLLTSTVDPVDLILCDMIMPGLNAQELRVALARAAPAATILYMSGYTGNDVIRKQLVLPSAPFIQKPFRPVDLALKVRALLDTRAESWPAST